MATVTTTFGNSELLPGGNTTVTWEWDESVDGFTLLDTNASAGELSNFQGSGTTYTATLTAPATGEGTIIVSVNANAVDQGNPAASEDIVYRPAFELGWKVPDTDENNDFSVILTSNRELSGVEISDFVLRREDAVFTNLNTGNTTLTQVADTFNWRLDISLTGTFNHDFQVRLRRNRIQQNSMNAPSRSLTSPSFHVDSSITTPDAPTNLNVDSVTQTSITLSFDAGDDGGAAVSDWEYELDGDGTWNSFGSTATTQTIPNLTHSTEYSIKMRGVNSEGNNGTASDALIATTATPPPVITVPDASTNLRVVSATTTDIDIAWNAPTNDGGAAIEDYVIDVDSTVSLTGSAATTARITGLSASETISIQVAAVNAEGTGTASDVLEAITDAEFTISTDEQDIREQKAFDINIAATGDVTNLLLGDISVTGATTDNLTQNAPNDYTLRVTADAGTGNIVISIAEDVVSPGNAAVSKTFTRKALPTVTVSVAITDLHPGAQTPVTIAWSEVVTGLTDAEVSVDIGNLSDFQGTGDTYTVILTAPTTPASGEITLSIAANAVDQGNVAYSVKIRYAPPSPPTWQPNSALQGDVDALETKQINIANLVDRADKIEAIGGLQAWLDFDGTDLIVSEAPIVRKDTEFRVTLKAINTDGSRKAVFILTVNASKLAMLQSTLFFKPSITYNGDRVTVHGTSIIVREMTDNNYETYSSASDVLINTADADGNPTTIHFIALKTKGVDAFSFQPSGGTGTGFSNRAMPTRFVATSGEDIPTLVNGFQHELYPLPDPVTATEVRLQFHGTDIEIYAVMLLELVAEIRDGDFLDIFPDKVDRTGEIINFPDGGVDRVSRLGAERWKWETEYFLEVLPEGTAFDSVPKVLKFIGDNPHIVHAAEPARYPERIYPAEMVSLEISPEYRVKRGYQTGGSIVPFRVAER